MIPAREDILTHLASDRYRPEKLKDLARAFGIGSDEYRDFRSAMRELERDGEVTRVHRGRYVLVAALKRVWGRLRIHERGFGFAVRAGAEADVFVPAGFLDDCVDGDWVEVEITEAGDGGERLPQGRVIGRRREQTRERLGVFRQRGRHGLVVAGEALISLDEPPAEEVRDGDLVVVLIEGSGASPGRPSRGRLQRVVGDPADPRHDFETVTLAQAIPVVDDDAAVAAAAQLAAGAHADRQEELAQRRDLRPLTVLTIDPESARDFDDALSLEVLATGNLRLGVHIADVAHYVEPGGAIDRQARERGTSVYLLDRVVHMLPAQLSCEVCSLAPGEDRLALSVLLDIDGAGNVVDRSLHLSVIRSCARLTYEQVQAALEGDRRHGGSATAHTELLQELLALSQRLRARRLERGAIDFDLAEAEAQIGADGVPVALGRSVRLPSHQLVEECMLAANEAVAEVTAAAGLPVLYRGHEPPDPAKLEAFRDLAGSLGQRLPPTKTLRGEHLQRALEALADRPDAALLSQLLLRAMMRARYVTDADGGHFGLASERYLHFTSPIRRYPDLLVQRALHAHLGQVAESASDLEWLAEWTSHSERRAEAAERDYLRLKQLRFMSERVGDKFDGIVSGVVGAGFFVELADWLVEGFCPLRLLEDDYFEFDETRHRVRGRGTGVVFAMGVPVRVQVVAIDLSLRRMDLLVIEGGAKAAPEPRSGRHEPRAGGRGDRRAAAKDARRGRRTARQNTARQNTARQNTARKGKGRRGRS